MTKTSKTIVFFGSGPVAAKSLELLAQSFTIEAVVTKPRAEHHRGSVPVLELTEKLGHKTFTPATKQELTELFATKPVASPVGVVIDYGIIIDQAVIDYFPYGIVNSHFSLLPEWRGADPITFAVLSGQKQTGVSLMLIVAKMDEGPLLGQSVYDLSDDITTPQLTDDLIELSDQMLQEILPRYLDDQLVPVPQVGEASYSRKLTKDDGILDWHKPAVELESQIRAFAGWPQSRTTIGGKDIVVTQAHAVPSNVPEKKPGDIEVIKVGSGSLLAIECSDGYLCIDKLKPAGKPEMNIEGFLAGYKSLL